MPLTSYLDQLKTRYFDRQRKLVLKRSTYDVDWGKCRVDQRLADDPGPVNSGNFFPVKRWIVLYRSPEAGVDGTHNITVTNVRTAISGSGSTGITDFIIHRFHVWLAPNTVNTHFSGVIYTKDDEANGILGGQYTDIAPYGEFVKFGIQYQDEGLVCDSTTSGNQEVLGLGGSAKWNGVVYALISVRD